MKTVKYIVFFLAVFNVSCMQEWLDVKPDKRLVVPKKISDFRAILNNTGVMNAGMVPALGEIGTDDYVLDDARYNAIPQFWEKNAYLWQNEIFIDNEGSTNWSTGYGVIYHSNLVLDGLRDLVSEEYDRKDYDEVAGMAYFFRALAYYQLAQVFCKAYADDDANQVLGLPLRLSADIEVSIARSSLMETYKVIISDLEHAVILLPDATLHKTNPSKATAHALLAKTYLVMGDYNSCLAHARQSLEIYRTLIDYNTLVNIDANYPIPRYSEEVLVHGTVLYAYSITPSRMSVPQELYQLYENEDLRKRAFYRSSNNSIVFKGSYNQSSTNFGGITTAEVFLIKAECEARLSNWDAARETLTEFLQNRYIDGVVAGLMDDGHILDRILTERRKELVFRGIRWSDLKRLNRNHNAQIALSRTVEGKNYTILPNDKNYVLPIPNMVIELSDIPQNER